MMCAGPSDFGDLASLIASVDCRIAAYVESAYSALFGRAGWLGPTMTAALTVYIAIYAYRLIAGMGALSVSGLARRAIGVGAVVAFASNWTAYQTVFVNLVFGGGEEIASVMTQGAGARSRATPTVIARLDAVFDEITSLANAWSYGTPLDATVESYAADAAGAGGQMQPGAQPIAAAPGGAGPVNMLWFSALTLALGSAGVLVVAKIMLGFLLALGPIFILLGLFPTTRGLFEGWLRALAANAFIPVFALLATAAALGVIEPIVAGIAIEQQRGENDGGSVFVLAIAAAIFGMLMFQALATTARLASAWRLPVAAGPLADAGPRGEAAERAPGVDSRIVEIVAAAGRDGANGSAASAERLRDVRDLMAATPAAEAPYRDDFGARRAGRAYRGFGSGRMLGSAA